MIQDVETPGFAALKKCGGFLPLNPVVIRTTEWINVPCIIDRATPVGGTTYWSGQLAANPDTVVPGLHTGWWTSKIPGVSQSLIDAVDLAAMANAVGAKWDVLTFLAEFGQSVESLRKLFTIFNSKVLDGLKQYKRFKRNPWQFFREEWLFWRYGIRPIVYDIESVLQSMWRLFLEMELVKGKGFQVQELLYSENIPGVAVSSGTKNRLRLITGTRTYRGAAYLEIDPSVGGQMLADPILTAWELTPWSFVVDKFVNIGAWLSTLTPQLLGEFRGRMTSVKTVIDARCVQTIESNASCVVSSATQGYSAYRIEEYTRTPGSGVPSFPGLNPRITLPFAVDLVALLVKGRKDALKLASRR